MLLRTGCFELLLGELELSLRYWVVRFEEESLLEICAEEFSAVSSDGSERGLTENSLVVHLEMSESVATSVVGLEVRRSVIQSSRTIIDRSRPTAKSRQCHHSNPTGGDTD